MRCRAEILIVGLLLLVAPSGAGAQSASRSKEPRWEVEIHGGGGFDRSSTDGRGALPPAGASFTTIVGFPSRRASTWYFGDGAVLLNQINASFSSTLLSGRVTPLDPVLQSAVARRGTGGSVGFRIGRTLTPRFGVEFTLDAPQGHAKFTDTALAGIESTRASFVGAWNERTGLVTSGAGIVFINPAIASVSTIDDDRGRQLFTSGALTINLATRGRIVPYAAVGAGVVMKSGDLPRATLAGSYRFDSLGALTGYFPVNETDTVTVRLVSARQHPLTTVLGGGVRVFGSNRWGVRADVRAYISKNTLDLLVDASPRVVVGTQPMGLIASTLVPSIQFSNFVGLDSTLSGARIDGFKTFTSQGTTVHATVSVGYFLRF
ncbi:MAG TPA: hypothetical protein VGQ37_14810 [Vicinamibacterales bacterium]|jgi:hypothetical protein|nr:hypothetical protein [Vicinamibacterales bacterium]